MRHITGSCHHEGSYRVMNSTGGHMLQRMGSCKTKSKAVGERCCEAKKKKGREKEDVRGII